MSQPPSCSFTSHLRCLTTVAHSGSGPPRGPLLPGLVLLQLKAPDMKPPAETAPAGQGREGRPAATASPAATRPTKSSTAKPPAPANADTAPEPSPRADSPVAHNAKKTRPKSRLPPRRRTWRPLLPLILLLLMSSSALLPVMACASVKSAEILAEVSKMFCLTGKPIIVPNSCALPMVPVAIIESLMVKPKGLFWIVRAVTMVPVAIIASLMVKRKSLFWIVLTFAVANSPVEAT
eukprot:scaffold27414_cov92-Phaeocystis_antarctica.AAC.1